MRCDETGASQTISDHLGTSNANLRLSIAVLCESHLLPPVDMLDIVRSCSITFSQTNAGALNKILASICIICIHMCLCPSRIRRKDVEECQIHETWYLSQSKLDLLVHATGSAVCIRQAADGGKSMIGQKVTVCGWAGASTSRARP